MFDIGWTELLVIAVVMIIVVGPKDLPAMLRTMGRYVGKLRRTASEFRGQFEDAIRESDLEEMRNELAGLRNINPANAVKDAVSKSIEPVQKQIDDVDSDLLYETTAAKPKTPRKKAARAKSAAPKKATPKKTTRARKPRAHAAAKKSKAGTARSRA